MEDRRKKEMEGVNQALVERLRIAMGHAQTNARELAERADVGRSFVYDILNGKSLNPTTHKLAAVAEVLGVSVTSLLYGEDAFGGRSESAPATLYAPSPRGKIAVASLSVAVTSSGATLVTEEKEEEPFSFSRFWIENSLKAKPADLRIIRVRGDGMAPTLSEGDYVLADTSVQVPSPSGIFILFDGYGLVAKRLEFLSAGGDVKTPWVQVLSDNPQYAPYSRPLEELGVIGRVAWFARALV